MPHAVRVLLVADTHLGFDLPARPRVSRRRRGHDFLANYQAALEAALTEDVDLVVHGGDVFHHSRVPPSLAFQAFQPLVRLADRGLPVFVVPGNHERSRLPHRRFACHEGVRVFDRPRTFTVEVRGTAVALSGFPFVRRRARARFPDLLERSGWRDAEASIRLLCMHQCVEGATVGPGDFTFRTGSDVVAGRDVPGAFTAVLSGHIHRHQVLTSDPEGHPLTAPVLYPGSVERTSLAEAGEDKGFMILHLTPAAEVRRSRWEFRRLPARPMLVRSVDADGLDAAALESALRTAVDAAPPDAVLRIRVTGAGGRTGPRLPSAARLRTWAPPTMNVEARSVDAARPGRASRGAHSRLRPPTTPGGRIGRPGTPRSRRAGPQLELGPSLAGEPDGES